MSSTAADRDGPAWVILLALAIATAAAFAPARAAATADLTVSDTRILAPSQGRPVFCQPGRPLTVLIQTRGDRAERPRLLLQNSLFPNLRYPLLPTGRPEDLGDGYASATVSVANSTPDGLYDLVLVEPDDREVVNRRSVSVVMRYKQKFRFVHLSNMNIGDPTAMDFDPHLPEEVNLLAPEFIVATGDFTEWARLCDHESDWQRVLDYMTRFEAPVYLVCGDHDHQASFTRHVASSPVGTIDYGDYHGLLLLDHGAHPIERDDDQVRWVLQDLEANRDKAFNFVVTHSDELGLLRRLRELDKAHTAVNDFNLKMIIAGGHTDWDYREFAGLLNGLPGLHFIRTAASSTAVLNNAPGRSHYRVIEVNGKRFSYIYPKDYRDAKQQYSVPSGLMHVTFDRANDGRNDPVTVHVASGLNRDWKDCRIWLRVRKNQAGERPAVAGGVLIRCLDAGPYWACQVGFDLPDKGGVTLQAGSLERLVAAPPVRMDINCSDQLTFKPQDAPFGLTYYTCTDPATLRLTNTGQQPVRAWPIVRLNGSSLRLTGMGSGALPLTLAPGEDRLLRISLTLGQVSPGPHMLQAWLLDDPLRRLRTQQVILLLDSAPRSGPATAQPAESPTSQPADRLPGPASQNDRG